MSATFRYTLIWVTAAFVAVLVTFALSSASFIDGRFLPVGHDAFYHGARVLDAVETGHLAQFDPRMHAPEGDWVTWPWAYDAALAQVVRVLHLIAPSAEPATLLMHLPPLLGVVGATLIVAIAAELALSPALALVAALCFALHAFTQYQFGIGALDHHGAEQLCALGSFWLALRWFARPDRAGRAVALGLGLGLALGVHAGLLILQIPVLAALVFGWWRGDRMPRRAAAAFCLGLFAGSLAILLPAETFWQSRFVLYYLSWLQLYVAVVTCAIALFVSRVPFSLRAFAGLCALASVLALPLVATVVFSSGFLSGQLSQIAGIDEIQSPFAIALGEQGIRRITLLYTHLVWMAPVAVLACLWRLARARTARQAYPWIAFSFGLSLLLLQGRLSVFGLSWLYLSWILLAQQWSEARPHLAKKVALGVALTMLVAFYPTLRHQLFARKLPAMDESFSTLRPVLPTLREACAREPGVVLAEPSEGHLVRYFTECSVISNNFRLTPLDVAKVQESFDLIAQPLASVRKQAPAVKYVIARLVRPAESTNPVLFRELLGGGPVRPEGVTTLVELAVSHPQDGRTEKFMGVYEFEP